MTSKRFEESDTALYRAGGSGVAWNETGGEIVVLDLDATVYFGLNASAAVLWKRLTLGAHRRDLVKAVMDLGTDGNTAARDVDEFLATLDSYGLLQVG